LPLRPFETDVIHHIIKVKPCTEQNFKQIYELFPKNMVFKTLKIILHAKLMFRNFNAFDLGITRADQLPNMYHKTFALLRIEKNINLK